MIFYRRRDFTSECEQLLSRYDAAVRAQIGSRITAPLRMRDWELYQVLTRLDKIDREARILDTGSFNTYLPLYLAQSRPHVTASDLLSYRRRKSWMRRLHLAPAKTTEAPYGDWVRAMREGGVQLREFDLTRIDAPDGSFDGVVSISVVEHIVEIERALAEMYRVLSPGGTLLLTTDCSPEPKSYRDGVRYFSHEELKQLFAPYPVTSPAGTPDFAKENWCYGGKAPVVTCFVEIKKPQ